MINDFYDAPFDKLDEKKSERNYFCSSNIQDKPYLAKIMLTTPVVLSLGFSIYIIITILLDIGSGYNEYNKVENLVKIVRKGFPGKNREILLTYPLADIRAIGIKITEGLNPTRSIYLCLKDERTIPLTPVQEPTAISSLEEEAADLAKFLDLKLENL